MKAKSDEKYKKMKEIGKSEEQQDFDIDLLINTEKKTDLKNQEKETFSNILITPKQLESMFTKKDFMNLEVLGQFNKGFIIAILREYGDVFIVDQHAADEKFNFEILSKTTKIHAQDLVCPIKMELSITSAITVR